MDIGILLIVLKKHHQQPVALVDLLKISQLPVERVDAEEVGF